MKLFLPLDINFNASGILQGIRLISIIAFLFYFTLKAVFQQSASRWDEAERWADEVVKSELLCMSC